MSVTVCLSLDFRTRTRTKTRADVGKWEVHANTPHHSDETIRLLDMRLSSGSPHLRTAVHLTTHQKLKFFLRFPLISARL